MQQGTPPVLALFALAAASSAAPQNHTDLYVPFDGVPIAGAAGAGVVLHGNAVIAAPDASYSTLPPAGAPTSLVVHLPLRGAVTAEVTASGAGDFAQVVAGPVAVLPAVEVAPGLSVLPIATLAITVAGHAEPGMRLSATADFVAPATFVIGAINLARLDADPIAHARAGDPELPAGGAASLSVTVDAGILCYVVLPGSVVEGPTMSVRHGFDLVANAAATPWWDLDERFTAFGGVLSLLGEMGTLDFDAADAGGPFPGVGAPTVRWSRAWDLGGGEDAMSIAPLDAWGGGTDELALVGNTSGSGAVGWFARLAPDGALVWEEKTTFAGGGLSRPETVHGTPDGGLLAGGNDGLAGGPRLDRLTGAGTSVWSKRYASAGAVLYLRGLLVRPDGGAVAACRVLQGGVSLPAALWLAPDGSVESALKLDLGPAVTAAGFSDVAATADGGYAFSGYAYLDDAAAPLGSRSGLVAKVDAQQALAFARVLGGTGYDDATGVAAAVSGRIAVAGRLTSGDPHSAWVAILDAGGALLSSNLYSDTTDVVFESAVDVDAVPGVGFVVAGTRNQAASADAWLFQIDERGMPEWWKRVSGADLDAPAEVRALAGGVLFCGRTQSTGAGPTPPSDLWAARTGVDGMLRLDAALGFDVANSAPTWLASMHTAAVAPPATLVPLAVTASTGAFVPIATAAGVIVLSL